MPAFYLELPSGMGKKIQRNGFPALHRYGLISGICYWQCSVSRSSHRSYFLSGTSILRPNPQPAQAVIHAFRRLIGSKTRVCCKLELFKHDHEV